MIHAFIENNTIIHYPNSVIFTGGGNSYISLTNPKSGAECILEATADGMRVQIKRTSVNGRDIIFPLSDILMALWEHAREKVDPMSINIDERKLSLSIMIRYDNRINKSLYFILINGSPEYDVTQNSTDNDRRRGVYWGNSQEAFELFATDVERAITGVKTSWSYGDITSESYISDPFLRISTIGTGTPPNGNADVLLLMEGQNNDNFILNSNFALGEENWYKWGNALIREIVEFDGKKWAHIKTDGNRLQGYQQRREAVIKPNTVYTLSFLAKTAATGQQVSVGIMWERSSGEQISDDWIYRVTDQVPEHLIYKVMSPADCSSFLLIIGNGMGAGNSTLITTEMWITEIKFEEGDNDNPIWEPNSSIMKTIPLYIDMCPQSERDMELNWFDELGVFCCWRFTEEYNETSVTTDATLTRMAVSSYSLYQSRTRVTRKQTTHTLHSRKVPRDVVPFIKSILSAPSVWRYNIDRQMDETMIVEDYKEKDYGRGYVDVVIKVTDTPQSYE